MEKLAVVVIGAISTFVLFFIVSLLFSIPVMLLWDWLMPTIFGLTTITIFQAWGLSVLSGLLFKSNISHSS